MGLGYTSALNDAISPSGTVYGFHINGNESDPNDAVTYLEDAVGKTPAYMDYTNDEFNYGSWENAFFMPKPCMLKYDGTVDYYLDPDDYTKKADGTASDVADLSYNGNAMMEWGQNRKKIWMKIVPSSDHYSADVYISDTKMDDDYHDWSFHNRLGNSIDHFYTAIYNGHRVKANDWDRLRSMSGKALDKGHYVATDIGDAILNNPDAQVVSDNPVTNNEMWNIECYADRLLITMLCILISKSLDSQTKFGYGYVNGSSSTSYTTGTLDTEGLFYGKTTNYAVKIFGMENYFGCIYRRVNGFVFTGSVFKVKMTYGQEDGSFRDGYEQHGYNYSPIEKSLSNTAQGSITKMWFTEKGMFPITLNGTSSTYFCDQYYRNSTPSGTIGFACCGGTYDDTTNAGLFYLNMHQGTSTYNNYTCACISCKPVPSE